MENTRNERAFLVVTAYVIGFITAFIAFGVSLEEINAPATVSTNTKPTSAITQSFTSTAVASEPQITNTERGLEFVHNGNRLILTANAASFNLDTTTERTGVHQAIVSFELSPDGQYVYYCDVPVTDSSVCRPFVFVIAEDTVYPVLRNGAELRLEPVPHTLSWDATGLVAVGGEAVDAR